MRYIVALGSNLGDRRENLRRARRAMVESPGCDPEKIFFSSIYQTQPVDCPKESDHFYNAVGIIESSLGPDDFLDYLQRIETRMGRASLRKREINAARPIDLDILFAGDSTIQTPRLTVPHPRWHERRFVLTPLSELLADTLAIGQTQSVADLLKSLPEDDEPVPVTICKPGDWLPSNPEMNVQELAQWRSAGGPDRPLLALTAYDYATARTLDEAGVDLILVGDSLGMVFAGLPDTTGVTMDQMVYHTEVVRRGVERALVVGDLPYRSYESVDATLENALRLMGAGADMVKLEGGSGQKLKIAVLTSAGIPTVGHLGMLPQRVREEGGYHKKGKTDEDAERLIQGAKDIEAAGVSAIVLESVVGPVAERITSEISVPTIGIGSGKKCTGEIRVINDLVGSYPWFVPPFAKQYADFAGDLRKAVDRFRDEISP